MRTWVLFLFCLAVVVAFANAEKKSGNAENPHGKETVKSKVTGKRQNGNQKDDAKPSKTGAGRKGKREHPKSENKPKKKQLQSNADKLEKSKNNGPGKQGNGKRKVKRPLTSGKKGLKLKKKCAGTCVASNDACNTEVIAGACPGTKVCCQGAKVKQTSAKRSCTPLNPCNQLVGECRKKKTGCKKGEKRYKNSKKVTYCSKQSCICCAAPCKAKKTCTKEGGTCQSLTATCNGQIKTKNSAGKKYCKGSTCGCCLPAAPATSKPATSPELTVTPKVPPSSSPVHSTMISSLHSSSFPVTDIPTTSLKTITTSTSTSIASTPPSPTTSSSITTTSTPVATTDSSTTTSTSVPTTTSSPSVTTTSSPSVTTTSSPSVTTTSKIATTITTSLAPTTTSSPVITTTLSPAALTSTATTSTPTTTACVVSRGYCPDCGVANISLTQNKIVNGALASINEFVYQVAVLSSFGTVRSICGGSIIKKRWILTAAHCFFNNRTAALQNGIEVRYGSTNLTTATRINATRYITHVNYSEVSYQNDVALVELSADLAYENDLSIQPICIAEEADIPYGGMAVVAGWGNSVWGGNVSQSLQYVALNVITIAQCQAIFVLPADTSKVVCAQFPLKDVCQGDSGGALAAQIAACSGRWVQIGIVSYGDRCTTTRAAVFTRVSAYKSWIDTNTGSTTC